MKNKTFYNKTKKIISRELKFLEMISKEHNYKLFAHHYGEKSNMLTVLTKLTKLYFEIIKFEEAHPDKVKEKDEEESEFDYELAKKYVYKRETEKAAAIAAEKAEAEAAAAVNAQRVEAVQETQESDQAEQHREVAEQELLNNLLSDLPSHIASEIFSSDTEYKNEPYEEYMRAQQRQGPSIAY